MLRLRNRESAPTGGRAMNWMLLPLKRYADFQGRSRRTEYWMFTLGIVIAYFVLFALAALLGGFGGRSGEPPSGLGLIPLGLLGIFALAIVIPALAVQVRRFHDQDKSGWLVLLGLIPYLGGLAVLVFMCLPGTDGPNTYGEDPKANIPADLAHTFE